MTERAAVIGSGPAGFYLTGMLLDAGFAVDLYDDLPTPYGLVRSGVAPDHPKIKAVTRVFDKMAVNEQFRFFGGVALGRDVHRQDLLDRYHAVAYAMGSSTDNRLGIPGEDLPGVHGAVEFVAWYNGHPDFADQEFDLSVERAVVVGNGNVAIDVARMLVLHPDEVGVTDTADHAITGFGESAVNEVVILGRRGPVQAAFTTPELRELGELTRGDIIVRPDEIELDPASQAFLDSPEADGTTKRNVALLQEYAQREPHGHSHKVELRFLRSPLEILGDERVEGVRVGVNRLEEKDGRMVAVPTGEEETIECGLVIRSIGYRGAPIDDVPFDERSGLIRNDDGRVLGDDGEPLQGEYAVGWIKRGPSGVIGTNKKCAHGTFDKIAEDREAGRLGEPSQEPSEDWVRSIADDVVTWQGWEHIDRHETGLGEPHGRPRVKLVRRDELHSAARGGPA
jgi:ferredoxin--NADP+ reductase